MGWGMGIGIGWPNVSTGSTPPVYEFTLVSCESDIAIVYSLSPSFGPEIYVYTDTTLEIPFVTFFEWNLTNTGPMYITNENGLVLDTVYSCG